MCFQKVVNVKHKFCFDTWNVRSKPWNRHPQPWNAYPQAWNKLPETNMPTFGTNTCHDRQRRAALKEILRIIAGGGQKTTLLPVAR